MPSVQEMLDQHLGPVTGTVPNPFLPDAPDPVPASPTKQDTVAAVADQKKAGLAQTADVKKADVATQTGLPSPDQLYRAVVSRNTGAGITTMPDQMQADAISMRPFDLIQKYGVDTAQHLMDGVRYAQGAVSNDLNHRRTDGQIAGDFASGIGLGVANSVGGVAALGAGMVNRTAGTTLASAIKNFNEGVQTNFQSDGMNAHRQLNAAQNELGYRDNEAQYQDTQGTDGTFVAGLRQFGKDAGTAIGNAVSDPTILSDGVAQGIGSLVTAGPIGKGIAMGVNALGGTLVKRALVEGAIAADSGATGALATLGRAATSPLGSKVMKFASHELPTMAGIGATEAGGAYQQNAADVMGTSFDDLAQKSPMFNQLMEAGMRNMGPNPTPEQVTALQEDARRTVASRSGLIAAAIQGPAATLVGAIASKFEGDPFALRSLKETGKNILKEGILEEPLQSGGGQLAQNIATRQTSNKDQDLLQGVGEQTGLGGLYGGLSAGAVGGPGAIMSSGTRGALGVGNKVSDLAGKRGDRIMAENEAKSPVSDQAVSTAAAEATQNTPAAVQAATDAINSHPDLTESQKEEAHSYVEAAKGVVHFDPAEVAHMPEVIQRAAEGQTSRIQFLQNLANEAKDPKNSPQDQAIALGTLTSSINNLTGENGLHIQGEDFKALDEAHPAKQFTGQVADLVTAFQQSSAGKTAVNPDRAEKVATKVSKDNLTAEQFDTPEGQQSVQANIAAATISPQNSNRTNNELILAMHTAGKVQLDNHQLAALHTANAILDGQADYLSRLKSTGLTDKSDLVSRQVTVNQGSPEGGESALEHLNAVRNAYGRGDVEGAKTALLGFQKFVQSQQNKIGAVNAQITAQGGKASPQNSLHYDAARRDKTGFTKSVKPFGVDVVGKNAAKSIGFVQQVAAETHALNGIHNALATAFPELGVKHLGEVSLDPSLSGAHPSKVAKEFADGTRGKPQEKTVAPEVTKQSETPATQSTSEASTNEAPKQPATPEVKESVKPAEPVAETTSLEQEREDLINRKIDAPLTKQEDARLAEIEKTLNPGASEEQPAPDYAPVKKYKTVGETETQGVATAFPSLVQFPKGNKFTASFKFPKAPITKLAGEENPLKAVTKSLSSEQAFGEATGKSTRAFDADVRRSYRKLLTYVPHIIDDINAEIQNFLAKGGKKEGTKTNQVHLDEGTADINRYRNGKLMNLVEESEDGQLVMNRQLAETAALAGLQWLLGSRNKSSHYDNGDIASIFGIDPDLVDANGDMENFLKSGALRIEGFDDLAQKIQSYWGVVPDSNADIAYTKGITQAVAAQIMKTLSRTPLADGGKLLEPDVMKVHKITGQILPKDAKVDRYVQSVEVLKTPKLAVFDSIAKMPDAIERVVAVKPELTHHLDGDMPQNSDEQMRNPGVKLTTEQNQMVANESDVPHRLDMESVDLFNKLNDGNWLVKIFGPGEIDEDRLNKNDLQSKEGQVLSITSAFQALKDTVAAVTARALDAGKNPEDVDIRYGYGVSKVGRLQMLGAFNPQASKLVRHAILPTQSTLNMLDSDHIRAFTLGVAQGIGVKVHNMSFAAARSKMLDDMAGKYAPALDVLQGYLKSGKLEADDMEKLHASLGSNASFATFYALKEYARLLNAQEAGGDITKFNTKLYLEADGMTNGPVMAMAMFARGATDTTWLQNMSRGGLYFGGLPFQNSTVQREIDPVDLYKATSNNLNGRIAANLTNPDISPEMKGQMRHVLHLMNILLGDNVIKFDGGDQVELERDIAKNPLTVTMYASGANGIANKIVGMLTDGMYQQMSKAMQNGWDKAEIFGPGQAVKNTQFLESLKALRSFTPEYDREKKQVTLQRTSNKPLDQSLKDFTFESGDLTALQKNIRKFFVNDMRKSITEVVGDSTFHSMDMVKTATQVQSIVLQHLFERGVEKALAERAKSDPTYQEGDFLSQRQLDDVRKSLSPLAPLIQAPGQTFYMAGRNQVGVAGEHFAAALDDDFRVPATVYGPGNIGVAGVASLNIGMGDGRMIQTFSNNPETDPRRLLIFDGIHLALDQINKGSEQANNAVWQTWMGNPLKAVSNAFDTFMQNLPATEVTEGSDLHKDLVKALFGPKEAEGNNLKTNPPEQVMNELQFVQQQLARAQMEVEARHAAMDQVNVSVDQMAAAASPYRVTDKEMVVGAPEQVAQRMSEITQAEYDKLRTREKKDPVKVEAIPTDLAKFGQEQPGGARVIGVQSVNNLIREVLQKIPRDQAVVLQSIQKTLAADGYSIVHGTREQLLAYNATLGANMIDASHLTDENTHGLTRTGKRQIWMISPSSETLTHELIHASTFQTVLNFYSGNDLGKTPAQTREAIRNLEVLMQQFTGLQDQEGGIDAMPREMQVAYNNAVTAIDQALNNPNLSEAERKAAALNEYMAWGLASTQLAQLQKRVDAHWLVKMAKNVVNLVRQMVFGQDKPMAPQGDMFSNLLFNTQVVMASQPSLNQVMQDTVLYQNSQYGNSDRLTELDDTFDRTVTNWIAAPLAHGDVRESRRRQWQGQVVAQDLGHDMAQRFSLAFPMTLQEKTTFGKMVAGLTTEASFDPNVLSRMSQLWNLVNKHLTADMLEDPNELDPNQRGTDAQRRVDALRGTIFAEMDSAGRSTLLPTFVALSQTNDQFRAVLKKIATEKQERSTAESRVDRALENLATDAFDSLGRRISGEGKSRDVLAAMDALSNRLMDIAQERQTARSLYELSGDTVDSANDYVVQGMNALAKAAVSKAEAIDAKFDNKLTKTAAAATRLFAAIINEEQAGHVAEGLLSYANRIQAFKPFTDLVHDMIGRVSSNAQVYDMIKTVRSMVQKMRQQFREEVPKIIAKQFSRELTEGEWDLLHKGMGRSDLASLVQGMSQDEALNMLKDTKARDAKIKELEDQIKTLDKSNFPFRQQKMQELAHYMMTGETSSTLLRNATAIARLAGRGAAQLSKADPALVRAIDHLTSLYALNKLGEAEQSKLSTLTSQEEKGMKFALSYLQGQRVDEMTKAQSNDRALLNHFKGYIPQVQQAGSSLIVADDAEYAKLVGQSYVRLGDYKGSNAEGGKTKKGYYYLPVSGRQAYQQGILQNVRQTAGGVDITSGYSQLPSAGRITDVNAVKRAAAAIAAGTEKGEHLMPVFDEFGEVAAYERSLDPAIVNSKLQFNTQLHQMLGVWRGRQVEEQLAAQYNDQLIDRLADMHTNDLNESKANQSRYIDVFDKRELAKDPVLADAVKLITPQMRQQIEQKFGKQFFVRRDMLNDALGYRSASIGDAWTGNSRWSDATQKQVQRLAMGVFGNKAYEYLVNAEKTYQNLISDAKTLIVVKSVVVPVANLVANAYQLAARGVPLKAIVGGMPRKTAEVKAYVASEVRRIAADAELRAAEGRGDVKAQHKLNTEIRLIQDGHKRLSIWPLIQAGEFSAVSDGKATAEEVELTSGRLQAYIERQVNKLPPGIRTAGRYAMVTKDTALFQGMQAATEYGDFLAKAILYDDLTKRKGMSKADALARVTEEFVNYDRLPGRFRGYTESMGLLWFYNFKIRSAKVALSMIRNNPVHALLAGLAPTPPFLGSIGLPTSDNLFTQLGSGRLVYSVGLGQLGHAPMMMPLAHIFGQ